MKEFRSSKLQPHSCSVYQSSRFHFWFGDT